MYIIYLPVLALVQKNQSHCCSYQSGLALTHLADCVACHSCKAKMPFPAEPALPLSSLHKQLKNLSTGILIEACSQSKKTSRYNQIIAFS